MNSTNGLMAGYGYDAYGRTVSSSGSLASADVYRFSSKLALDTPSMGLYCYGFRFYEPGLQRWMSRDPLRERGGLNLYSFCWNDPSTWGDPYGLAPWEKFNTANLAMKDLLQWFCDHPATDSHGNPWEQSATIFKDKDGKCYYPLPRKGDLPGRSPYDLKRDKGDSTDMPVHHAHTHIKGEDFSPQDITLANSPPKIPETILIPSGDIRRYDPRMSPATNKIIGNINAL